MSTLGPILLLCVCETENDQIGAQNSKEDIHQIKWKETSRVTKQKPLVYA